MIKIKLNRCSSRKIKYLREHLFMKSRVVRKPLNFIRSNRCLKLASRSPITEQEYYMLQQFVLNDHIEFKIIFFFSYYFGLSISEILTLKTSNLKQLSKRGRTTLVSSYTGSIKQLILPQKALKELVDITTEIPRKLRTYKIKRKSDYIIANRIGEPFKAVDLSEVVNLKLLEIVYYLDLEEECCWSLGNIRLSSSANIISNNDFFSRFGCHNRWFFEDDDIEFSTFFELNYTVSYYYARILDEVPYIHINGLIVYRDFLFNHPSLHTPTNVLERSLVEIERLGKIDNLSISKNHTDLIDSWVLNTTEYLPSEIPTEIS